MCGDKTFISDSLESQSCDFDEIANMKSLYSVERLHKGSFKS